MSEYQVCPLCREKFVINSRTTYLKFEEHTFHCRVHHNIDVTIPIVLNSNLQQYAQGSQHKQKDLRIQPQRPHAFTSGNPRNPAVDEEKREAHLKFIRNSQKATAMAVANLLKKSTEPLTASPTVARPTATFLGKVRQRSAPVKRDTHNTHSNRIDSARILQLTTAEDDVDWKIEKNTTTTTANAPNDVETLRVMHSLMSVDTRVADLSQYEMTPDSLAVLARVATSHATLESVKVRPPSAPRGVKVPTRPQTARHELERYAHDFGDVDVTFVVPEDEIGTQPCPNPSTTADSTQILFQTSSFRNRRSRREVHDIKSGLHSLRNQYVEWRRDRMQDMVQIQSEEALIRRKNTVEMDSEYIALQKKYRSSTIQLRYSLRLADMQRRHEQQRNVILSAESEKRIVLEAQGFQAFYSPYLEMQETIQRVFVIREEEASRMAVRTAYHADKRRIDENSKKRIEHHQNERLAQEVEEQMFRYRELYEGFADSLALLKQEERDGFAYAIWMTERRAAREQMDKDEGLRREELRLYKTQDFNNIIEIWRRLCDMQNKNHSKEREKLCDAFDARVMTFMRQVDEFFQRSYEVWVARH
eukprot:PhF_6_TR10359/c0_g2_i1/m.16047